MDIKLDFFNRCDSAQATVLVYQQGMSGDSSRAVAWKVIRNCGSGWHHPFTFSSVASVNVSDAYGNHVQQLSAAPGSAFDLKPQLFGRSFGASRKPARSDEIVVRNGLLHGAVHANLYSGDRLLGCVSSVVPGMHATFRFHPQIWVAVIDDAVEGSLIDVSELGARSTEFSLRGIASAELVMRDAETDPDSETAFSFTLENVVRA